MTPSMPIDKKPVAEATGREPDVAPPTVGTPGCDYCGLPVAGRTADGPAYCCHGCRFAAAITGAGGDDGRARWMMTRLGLAIFFTMNVMVFTMLLWSQQESAVGPAAAAFYDLARHACLLFTAPVLLLLGGPLVDEALDEVRRGRPAVNLLLFAGVAAAFGLSAWSTWTGGGHVYYEVACMVLVAVTLGRWLEASGKLRTTAALRELRGLLPDRVRCVEEGGVRDVDLATVRVGDRLRILPGEHLPTDGEIVAGVAAIDEAAVTGESVPAEKRAGDAVYSGTTNLDGQLDIVVAAAPGAGTLERLIDAVTAAAGNSRRQRLAERISAWFLPVVIAVALAACAVHWRRSGAAAGVLAGLAVVVVACPCALGLATPLALWAAIGQATRRHVLVREGDALENLARADTFCFDKTGTLTAGCRLAAVAPTTAGADDALLAVAASLAAGSTHVLSRAIVEAAAARGWAATPLDDVRTVPGSGVAARRADTGVVVRLGSPRWIRAEVGAPPAAAVEGMQCLVAEGDRIIGGLSFAETIRPEAAATVQALRAMGGTALLLSGDRRDRAEPVAASLGMEWQAPLLPAEKLAVIDGLQRRGRRVAMVGDGINDAPALATADVGVALGCGADVSRWSAGVCLLRDDLSALPWLVTLARRTDATIRWNLLWAFAYNAACVPLAAAGFVHPAVAAAAMVASSLLVVTNSLRLASASVGGEVAG
jgi:heavy metal translocating P-type ATPase